MFHVERDHRDPLFLRMSAATCQVLDLDELIDDLDETAQQIYKGELAIADLILWEYYIVMPSHAGMTSVGGPIPVILEFREPLGEPDVQTVYVMYSSAVGYGPVILPDDDEGLHFNIYPKGPRPHSEIVRENPELGLSVLEKAYDANDGLANVLLTDAWDVLVAAVGRARAGELINEKFGQEKGHKILAAIKGQV